MSFAKDLETAVGRAHKKLQAKTKEERKQFLIRSGVLDEKGKLRQRFRSETDAPNKRFATNASR